MEDCEIVNDLKDNPWTDEIEFKVWKTPILKFLALIFQLNWIKEIFCWQFCTVFWFHGRDSAALEETAELVKFYGNLIFWENFGF